MAKFKVEIEFDEMEMGIIGMAKEKAQREIGKVISFRNFVNLTAMHYLSTSRQKRPKDTKGQTDRKKTKTKVSGDGSF